MNRTGCNRIVLEFKDFVIKLPNFLDGWKLFLRGLLCNCQEIEFWPGDWHEDKLCPITFYISGGWLLVMPRARILTDQEFLALSENDYLTDWLIIRQDKEFSDCTVGYLPTELKSNSFGYLKDSRGQEKLVVIDYGS